MVSANDDACSRAGDRILLPITHGFRTEATRSAKCERHRTRRSYSTVHRVLPTWRGFPPTTHPATLVLRTCTTGWRSPSRTRLGPIFRTLYRGIPIA